MDCIFYSPNVWHLFMSQVCITIALCFLLLTAVALVVDSYWASSSESLYMRIYVHRIQACTLVRCTVVLKLLPL